MSVKHEGLDNRDILRGNKTGGVGMFIVEIYRISLIMLIYGIYFTRIDAFFVS